MRPERSLTSRAKEALTSAAMSVREKIDAWENVLTGMGTRTRDKTTAGIFQADYQISDQELTSLYTGSDMAARVVDCVPEECFREGFEIVADDFEEEIEQAAREFPTGSATGVNGIAALFADLMRWGRLYGGCALVLGADDSGDAQEALREDAIQTFRVARVVDRRWIWPVDWYRDPSDPKFGNPSVYQITTLSQSVSVSSVRIHESRLILMGGATTPADVRLSRAGWDSSVLNRCYGPLRQFDSNWKALELLLTDSSQGVFKIKDLYNIMAQGNEVALMQRMNLVDMSRSVARSILIDDTEDFHRDNHSFAGIADCLDKSAQRLSAAAGIPVTVLMGEAPAGLNATGDSDLRLWYAGNKSKQTQEAKPRIERFLRLLCLSKDGPTGGKLPENLRVKFRPLREATPKEQAEIYKLKADGDKVYIDSEVILPEEVALSRFKPDGFSVETQIDRDAREALLNKPTEPTEVSGQGILTATSNEAVVTVNEARAVINLPPLTLPAGGNDPDGDLTVAEFRAKREAKGTGIGTELGGGTPPGATPPQMPPQAPPVP